MKIITMASAKGGVGKTTNAVFLAQALAHRGLKTLAVDLDPNNSLTDYFLRDYSPDDIEHRNVLHLLTGSKQADDCIFPLEIGLSVMGSTPELASFPTLIARDAGAIMRLSARLKKLDYDAIVIDTPPSLGPLLTAGLMAAHVVLTPVSPHRWILQASRMMARELALIAEDTGKNIPAYAVFSMVTKGELETMQALGLTACQTAIMKAAPLAKAIDHGTVISPKGAAFDAFLALSLEVYPND
jgi:chromosome partitioning protein